MKVFRNSSISLKLSVVLPFAVESWAEYPMRSFADDPAVFHKFINKEHAVGLLNHRGDIDWMVGWVFLERTGMLGV